MKPLLKSYVNISPAADGVFFQAGERSFLLKGKGIFAFVTQLLQRFDGRHDMASIDAAVPEKARALVSMLIAKLSDAGMLHLIDDRVSPELPDVFYTNYRSVIAFLQDETPHFAELFLQWRNTPAVVAGAGHSFRALATGLVKSGVARLSLFTDAGMARADRDELDADFTAHARLDPEFRWTWCDRPMLDAALAEAGMRLLYAADDLPADDGDALLHHAVQSRSVGGLVGGIYRRRALVGPLTGGANDVLEVWRKLAVPPDGAPYSVSTCSIIGALIAFEALKAQLYVQHAQGGDAPWSQRNFFWITPGGEVTTHPLDGVTAGSALRKREDPPWPADTNLMVKERRRLEAAMAALFDPLTGILAWDNDNVREFPLPHQRIALRLVRPDAEPQIVPVVQWALTPQEAGLRTLLKAVTRYAQASLSGPLDAPVIVATNPRQWEALALAHAIVRSTLFAQRRQVATVSPQEIGDTDIQMLLRLGRLYGESLPVLRIAWIPGLPAFLAETEIGTVTASAVAASATQALVESLGEALSRWQLGHENASTRDESAAASDLILAKAQTSPISVDDLDTQAADLNAFGYKARAEHLKIAALEGSGLIVGRIELIRDAP